MVTDWTEDTFLPGEGHRCEPSDPDGREIVFFACGHCGRTWVLNRGEDGTDKWSPVED